MGETVKFQPSRPALPAFCHIMELMARSASSSVSWNQRQPCTLPACSPTASAHGDLLQRIMSKQWQIMAMPNAPDVDVSHRIVCRLRKLGAACHQAAAAGRESCALAAGMKLPCTGKTDRSRGALRGCAAVACCMSCPLNRLPQACDNPLSEGGDRHSC